MITALSYRLVDEAHKARNTMELLMENRIAFTATYMPAPHSLVIMGDVSQETFEAIGEVNAPAKSKAKS